NVTLFGWSSGGSEISQLAAMPLAEGLFHKIIVQSGAILKLRSPETAAAATDRALTRLGLTRATARQLLTLPMTEIIKVANTGGAPTLDGRSTPRHEAHPDDYRGDRQRTRLRRRRDGAEPGPEHPAAAGGQPGRTRRGGAG